MIVSDLRINAGKNKTYDVYITYFFDGDENKKEMRVGMIYHSELTNKFMFRLLMGSDMFSFDSFALDTISNFLRDLNDKAKSN